jgi:hypothetical protein
LLRGRGLWVGHAYYCRGRGVERTSILLDVYYGRTYYTAVRGEEKGEDG